MRIGDLDGRNRDYKMTAVTSHGGLLVELSGSIVLEQNERILSFTTEFMPRVRRISLRIGSTRHLLFPTSEGKLAEFFPADGWGTLYVTDRRLLFLRKPSAMQARAARGIDEDTRQKTLTKEMIMRLSEQIHSGSMVFLEIRHEDVTGYSRGHAWANVRFRAGRHQYAIRIPRKALDDISPFLGVNGVRGRTWPLMLPDVPFAKIGVATILGLILLVSMTTEDDGIVKLCVITTVLFLGLVAYLLWNAPMRILRRGLWGWARRIRIWILVSFTIATAIFVLGMVVAYLNESALASVFVLSFTGIAVFSGLVRVRELKRKSALERTLGHEYRCGNCGGFVTRTMLGCPRCGSCVWWLRGIRIVVKGKK